MENKAMGKYYAVKAPIDLNKREGLKASLQAKRLFDDDTPRRYFRRKMASAHDRGVV